jgi:hypothetical protein
LIKTGAKLTNIMVVENVAYASDKKIGLKKGRHRNFYQHEMSKCFSSLIMSIIFEIVRKCSCQLLININSSIFKDSFLSFQITEHNEQKNRMKLTVILLGQLLRT